MTSIYYDNEIISTIYVMISNLFDADSVTVNRRTGRMADHEREVNPRNTTVAPLLISTAGAN